MHNLGHCQLLEGMFSRKFIDIVVVKGVAINLNLGNVFQKLQFISQNTKTKSLAKLNNQSQAN